MGLLDKIFKTKKDILSDDKKVNFLDFNNAAFSSTFNTETNLTYVSICEAHARHISKIKPAPFLKDKQSTKHKYLNYILGLRPNEVLTASQLWETLARDYFMNNLAIAFLEWDYNSIDEPLKKIYPLDIDKNSIEVSTNKEKILLKFKLNGETLYSDMNNLLILHRNATPDQLFGGRSKATDLILKLIQTNYEGIEQAIKTSSYIRFIVTSHTPLRDEIKKNKAEEFRRMYLHNNESGVVYMDSAENLTQVQNPKPKHIEKEDMEFLEKQIYQYLGGNEKILMGTYNENEWQSYYETTLEPFIIKLQDELTYKIFTKGQINAGNYISVNSNRLQTASVATRVAIAEKYLKLPVIVPNVINDLLFLPSSDNGWKEYSTLNYVETEKQNEYQFDETNTKIENDNFSQDEKIKE